jgi:hypothetical protein
MIDALGRVLGVIRENPDSPDPDPLSTLRSGYAVRLSPARMRARRSKLVIAGLAIVLAPLAVMLSSAGIAAHTRSSNAAVAAIAARAADQSALAAAAATAAPVPKAPAEQVALAVPVESAEPAPVHAPASAVAPMHARTASASFAPSKVERPASRQVDGPAHTAAPDDVDFGF